MLSIEKCREILNMYNYSINEDEITSLRDFLTMLALAQNTNNKESNN